MNKKTILFFVMLNLFQNLFAQDQRLWATYYGGTGNDYAFSTTVDNKGNVYLAGNTASSQGIASGGLQDTLGGGYFGDTFVVKFDSTGNRIWATYIGGEEWDACASIVADRFGNIYVAGTTLSTSGLAYNGFQSLYGGGNDDAFIIKLDSSGNKVWATYYGGEGDDEGRCISIDASGNLYLTGTTTSITGIATTGSQNSYMNGRDAFLVRFNTDGNRIWAIYYGGWDEEQGLGVTTDHSGNVYMTGYANSSTGIALNGFQNTGTNDAFLVKFDSTGVRFWGTYFGGPQIDMGYSVVTDSEGNVYMGGLTASSSGIAHNGFRSTIGGTYDDMLVKFNSQGNRLWATYVGGNYQDEMSTIAIDSSDNVYLCGTTYSTSGIGYNGYQNNIAGAEDLFVVKLDHNGNLICATNYGQGHDEDASIAVDARGNVYLSGGDTARTGIAFNGFQNNNGGGSDAYLVKFSPCTNSKPVYVKEEASKEISLFPNPTNNSLTVRFAYVRENFDLKVYNELGEQVFVPVKSKEEYGVVLYVGHLDKGFYYLQMLSTLDIAVKKFEVIR